MNPKKIIIKTINPILNKDFCNILKTYPKIKFFNKYINGEYTTVVKCSNYYNNLNLDNIYGSYIYLYTNISLILSELIIKHFEHSLVNHLLNYYYFSTSKMQKIKNISFFILDSNFPSEHSRKLYLYKKELILNKLLLNFRKQNYLLIEGFANFSLDNYYLFLDNVLEKVSYVYFSNNTDIELINFILNNLFKWYIL